MLPYLTPTQIRLEREQRERVDRFPGMNARIRAELEARLLEESESALVQRERPAQRFSLRVKFALPRLAFLKLQRNLK